MQWIATVKFYMIQKPTFAQYANHLFNENTNTVKYKHCKNSSPYNKCDPKPDLIKECRTTNMEIIQSDTIVFAAIYTQN